MNEEEWKAVEAEALTEVLEAPLQNEEIDYRALAEAEQARADAAEALIVKNKAIAKRAEVKEVETTTLTREEVLELIKANTPKVETDDSIEATALVEANKKLAEMKAKNSEIARALKAKDGARNDTASTQFDGEKGTEPKLAESSPLKAYKHEGNNVYSLKLASGKTHYKRSITVPGLPSSWVA